MKKDRLRELYEEVKVELANLTERTFRAYAKEAGIRLRVNKRYSRRVYNGFFQRIPDNPTIWVHSDFKSDPEFFKYLLAHEFGHAEDYKRHTKKYNERMDLVRRAFDRGIPGKGDLKRIIAAEKRADKLGRSILRRLNLAFYEKAYDEEAKVNIEGYNELFRKKTNE